MIFARSSVLVSGSFGSLLGLSLLGLLVVSSPCLSVSEVLAETAKKSPAKHDVPASIKKGSNNSQPLSDFDLGKYQYCGTDSDCILAQNGCCDCANGGQDIAINKERVSAFQSRFDCLHVECTEKATEPPCASGVVSCINHKCRYIGEEPSSSKKKKRK